MKLIVHSDARDLGIQHPAACLIDRIQVQTETAVLDDDIHRVMHMLRENLSELLSRTEVAGFEGLFARMGYPNQRPAGRRLIETFRSRGFRKYNNIIDAYNLASLQFGCGLGMHDAHGLGKAIHVCRARGSEQIVPLFKDTPRQVTQGDLIYATDGRVLAWLGKHDVDSNEFRVQDGTTSIALIALGNSVTPAHYNRAVCDYACTLIRKTCPNMTVTFSEVVQAE